MENVASQYGGHAHHKLNFVMGDFEGEAYSCSAGDMEEVGHWVVTAGDFDRRPVWPCIIQKNCKWTHEIEKNNRQSGPCLQHF